jgi:hypothetical protein
MEWWNDFVDWFYSSDGRYVVSGILLPAAAIIVAGLLGAWIAGNSIKRLLAKHDREMKAAAIASLIDAAEQASVWNSLTPQEQVLSDRAVGQADIQVRMLPIKGSDVAANWAAHSLATMRRDSATFGYQVQPAVVAFRDRLIEWQERPGRSRRAFQSELDQWQLEDDDAEKQLARQQDDWVAQQQHEQQSDPDLTAATVTTPTSTRGSQAPTAQVAPAQRPSGTSLTPEEEATRLETLRVLENVNAVERHVVSREESDGEDNDDSTPPPVHAFPPRRPDSE